MIKNRKIVFNSDERLNYWNSIKGKELKDFPFPPFSKLCGGKFISVKRGEVEMEFDARPEMDNATGILHGGMMCGFIDNAMGFAIYSLGYETAIATVGIHVSFLGKVPIGEKIRIKASVFREGRHILHATAKIYDSNGKIVALANSDLLLSNSEIDYHKYKRELQ